MWDNPKLPEHPYFQKFKYFTRRPRDKRPKIDHEES